ncbi:hypothetical protein EVAR_17839_1 [Eumeta japonica]|uniref:Uncharacterized protein n=1 Tax=Eumeta variegata TaxID=151549 RepID=A0A4C1TU81_EUMVA|nr:hypothetical protein EVAR_17839_1 [Eumeta japonica]
MGLVWTIEYLTRNLAYTDFCAWEVMVGGGRDQIKESTLYIAEAPLGRWPALGARAAGAGGPTRPPLNNYRP